MYFLYAIIFLLARARNMIKLALNQATALKLITFLKFNDRIISLSINKFDINIIMAGKKSNLYNPSLKLGFVNLSM